MSNKKRILLDCDGVLADFIGEVIETIVAHGGPRHVHADVIEFNFSTALKLDPDLARLVKRTISKDPGWWIGLDPFQEAIEGVAKLREVADVFVVTSPWNSCQTWLFERESWLKQHFDIPHSHVLAGSAKHIVSGHMLVDDKTEACAAWDDEQSAAWQMPDGTREESFAVQWQTPHNRLDEWHGRSTRSWSELLEWAR
jgi:5'(3')-deoxyribonucleotidase